MIVGYQSSMTLHAAEEYYITVLNSTNENKVCERNFIAVICLIYCSMNIGFWARNGRMEGSW